MELWLEVKAKKWGRLNNPEVMGYDVARKAGEVADFFRNISYIGYDTYATNRFGFYVECAIRGYQANMQMWDDIYLTTTLDLHHVKCTSYALNDFDYYLGELWKDYFMYALDKGI